MAPDPLYASLLLEVESFLEPQPDKPEETPAGVLKALWFSAAGEPRSLAATDAHPLPAIDEVTTAVRQMDEMTQHNAALVEEINASIEQTESQATELDRIVDIFTIADQPARSTAPAARDARGRREQVKTAAKAYLATDGNAAIDKDWAEF